MEYCSLKASRISLGARVCPPSGSVKFGGPRSLQIGALGSASGEPMDITNPVGRMAAGKCSEGLGKEECSLRSGKPWWAPIFKFGEGEGLGKEECSLRNGRVLRAAIFTEEKARALRRELRATESWHDLMYHSAIASRLAFSDHDSA